MIDMDNKEQLLHYHRIDGLSLREISRRVGLNRKTVPRYIREYEAQVSSDPEEGADMCLASRPKYPPRKVERSKLTDAVCAEIDYWLSENAKRRQTGMRKQCLKRQDIHRALIEKGFSISYSSVCKYIQQRKTEKTLRNLEIKFERYDLVICDELGYVGFDKESAEMLFNQLSLRTGNKSTIITTNLPFTRWEEVLKDKVLCSALVDRLCHKSYLVNMTGTSYRIKETRKIINNK